MIFKRKEIVWACILVVVFIYLYIEAGKESELISATIEGYSAMARPSFWPRVMLVGLLVTSLLKLLLNAKKTSEQVLKQSILAYILVPKAIISIIIIGIYCISSQYLGFPFTTIIFTAVYMWFLGLRKIKIIISFPILITLFVLLFFWRILYIGLPKGEGVFLVFSNFIMSLVRIGS